jgi:DNA-binding SARP family transcriptional activator
MNFLTSRFIGYFFNEKLELWNEVSKISNTFKNKIYLADEYTVNKVKSFLPSEENFEVVSSNDFYLREEVVREKPIIEALKAKIENVNNSETVVFIEMTWAVRTPSSDIYLREIHEAFQFFLEEHPITIVCLYNESILLDKQLMLGLWSHPTIYTPNGNVHNPYYLPPSVIRTNHKKLRFNYWLGNIHPSWNQSNDAKIEEIKEAKKAYPLQKSYSTKTAQTNEGRWKIRCFGELKIRRENGETIDWNTKAGATRKIKTLFAFLLIRGKKGAKGEELADLLWPDAESTELALNRLYQTIRHLRMVLEDKNDRITKSSFIVHQSSNYYLKLPYDSWIDLPMFEEMCFKGNNHLKENNLEQVKICYESAERLYSGHLFNDIPQKYIDDNENDWLWSKRLWYQDMYHKLLYSLAGIHRQLGDLTLALKYCDKALNEDPSLEAAHREKLMILADSKRFDAVQRQYRIYCESLKKFNSGQPSEEIKQLYLNILKTN